MKSPAGEPYELRQPTRAMTDQKARIAQLLDSADIEDDRRVAYAEKAGPSTFVEDEDGYAYFVPRNELVLLAAAEAKE